MEGGQWVRFSDVKSRLDRIERLEAEIERVLVEEHGLTPARPLPRDEWGPVCAGCGGGEYRIDGFCSVACRDGSELAADLFALFDKEGSDG